MIALSVFFLIICLFFFSLYKLGVLFGPPLVLSILGAGLLLISIAYCLSQASGRLIVKRKPAIAYFFTDQLRGWARRQYVLMNAYLSCGMLSAVGLSFLGVRTLWMHLTHPVVGVLDVVISTFGVVVACLGISFTLLFLKEFGFVRKNKSEIIEKIFEQVKGLHAGIQQYPQV